MDKENVFPRYENEETQSLTRDNKNLPLSLNTGDNGNYTGQYTHNQLLYTLRKTKHNLKGYDYLRGNMYFEPQLPDSPPFNKRQSWYTSEDSKKSNLKYLYQEQLAKPYVMSWNPKTKTATVTRF